MILVSMLDLEVKNVSAYQTNGEHLCWRIGQNNTNLVEYVE